MATAPGPSKQTQDKETQTDVEFVAEFQRQPQNDLPQIFFTDASEDNQRFVITQLTPITITPLPIIQVTPLATTATLPAPVSSPPWQSSPRRRSSRRSGHLSYLESPETPGLKKAHSYEKNCNKAYNPELDDSSDSPGSWTENASTPDWSQNTTSSYSIGDSMSPAPSTPSTSRSVSNANPIPKIQRLLRAAETVYDNVDQSGGEAKDTEPSLLEPSISELLPSDPLESLTPPIKFDELDAYLLKTTIELKPLNCIQSDDAKFAVQALVDLNFDLAQDKDHSQAQDHDHKGEEQEEKPEQEKE